MIPEEWSKPMGDGEKSATVVSVNDDPELMAKLMEFELMALDEEPLN
jgi:hypothetical protein